MGLYAFVCGLWEMFDHHNWLIPERGRVRYERASQTLVIENWWDEPDPDVALPSNPNGCAAWVSCPNCEDFLCLIHAPKHAWDCSCPPVEEWRVSPYLPQPLART